MRRAEGRLAASGLAAVLACSSGGAGLASQNTATTNSATLAIEVHVVNQSGDPVTGLRPDQFQVLIGGRAHAVTTARFISGRTTFILGIDQTSFGPAEVPAARDGARRLMGRIGAEDALGFVAFPGTTSIAPGTNRQPVSAAIERIVGLWPEVPADQRPAQSVSGLEAAIRGTAAIAGRKTFVVVSAGIAMPKETAAISAPGAETEKLARVAEAAGVTLDVLYLDGNNMQRYGPRLFSFAKSTGGTLYQLGYGADRFIGNLVKDASAYYVLDVAPLETERDGKQHALAVGLVDSRGATVRSRGAVTIPAR